MIVLREETPLDIEARERLLDLCFGPARFQKTCERLREGRVPADGLSLAVEQDGVLIGTIRLWHVMVGPNRPALMLGPVAVDPSRQDLGVGAKLIRTALQRATDLGHGAVVLVGDAPYYERFGFAAETAAGLWLPGPYERERFLGLALRPGALDGAKVLVSAAGALAPKPDWAALVAAAATMRPAA
jgi:predicted N-acetyltransferase YhbS